MPTDGSERLWIEEVFARELEVEICYVEDQEHECCPTGEGEDLWFEVMGLRGRDLDGRVQCCWEDERHGCDDH